ncbi:hypothetical protein, partial [Sporisorium scitamineum]
WILNILLTVWAGVITRAVEESPCPSSGDYYATGTADLDERGTAERLERVLASLERRGATVHVSISNVLFTFAARALLDTTYAMRDRRASAAWQSRLQAFLYGPLGSHDTDLDKRPPLQQVRRSYSHHSLCIVARLHMLLFHWLVSTGLVLTVDALRTTNTTSTNHCRCGLLASEQQSRALELATCA